MTAWTPDEESWAIECIVNGDSLEEIAAWCGRTVEDVRAKFRLQYWMTDREREVLSLYMAGCSFATIDAERGVDSRGRAFTHKEAGKAAAAVLSRLRKRGIPVPCRGHGVHVLARLERQTA